MKARAWIVVGVMVIVGLPTHAVHARPGGGRAGGHPAGGMARPAGGMSRPAMPAARPSMPAARPQMPAARPQMPAARPQMPAARPQMPAARPQMPTARPNMPTMSRPQAMQRPSLGNAQTPGMNRPAMPTPMGRPALPTAGARPGMPSAGMRPGMPSTAPRPGIGSMRPAPATRPAPGGGPSRPGAGGNRPATTLPGQVAGPTTKPAFPQPAPGGRPGVPTTKPAPQPGFGGGRPDGNRPGLGNVQRPTTLPGTVPGGNRPGIGGNRPGIGGNRPDRPGVGDLGGATTLPGTLGPNRPGIGGNRPGTGGNRPGIGGNRPGIGDGNNFWNSGNINSGNWNNTINNVNFNRPWGGGGWAGGGWGYPGYGGWGYPGYGGGWAGAWNGGCVNPHYGWYNGCWGGGWWAPFAVGAATWGLASTVANWGLGYGAWGYNTAYANPYYTSIPATVVATSPYDYAQPVAVTTYATDVASQPGAAEAPAPPADTVTESERVFDEALARFKAGDYTAALAACDKAVRLSPKDPIVHEVRALALFALARYPEAAATLNAILAAAPGMDWTTMSGLYGSVDAYTTQLRKLEEFCRSHPGDAAAHFVLAYHYLVGGYNDMAADALRVVVAKQPGDAVAKQLLASLEPAPAAAPAAESAATASAGPEIDLVGTWQATAGGDTVTLTVKEDSTFVWKAAPKGQPAVEISGTIETSADAIAMVSEKAGTMGGKVVAKGPDAFEFTLAGGPPGAKPLAFQRQK